MERPRSPCTTRPIHRDVLHGERPVEPEIAVQALHVLAGGLGAQHDGGRIAGGQVHHGEDEQRDPEEDGDGEQQARRTT